MSSTRALMLSMVGGWRGEGGGTLSLAVWIKGGAMSSTRALLMLSMLRWWGRGRRRRVGGGCGGGWLGAPRGSAKPRPLSPSSLPQVDDLVKELGGPGLASAPSGGKGKPSLLSDAPSASSAGTQQQGGLVGELAASGSNSAAAQQYSAATAAPASSLLASEAVRLLLSVLQVLAVLYLGAGVWSAAGSLKGIAASLAARPGGAGAGADL